MFAYNEENFIPSISRSSSERSSSSTGSNVCSNKFGNSLSRNDGYSSRLQDNFIPEARSETDPDLPLWDMDIRDPACTWDLELSQRLAEKLIVANDDHVKKSSVHQLSQSQPSDYLNLQLMSDESFLLNSTIDNSGATNPRFKTEICRNFKEKGTCLYGDLCQFAHGIHELRKDVIRHNKYKTKHCQKYWIHGYCAYGPRCNFIHQERDQTRANTAGPDSVTRRHMNPVTFKTAAQVVNFANLRKANLGDPSDSSGSEDGRMPSRNMNVHVMGARDQNLMGLDKFPTFVPRNLGLPGYVAPVGSGRPRVVWPGA